MFQKLNDSGRYSNTIAILALLSFIFAIVFSFGGELFLPLAVAFYSALLIFENPKRRIFSYLVPIVSIVITIALTDFYSLITFEFVILSVVLAVCFNRKASKAETILYTSLILSLFVLLSLYLGATKAIGSFEPSLVFEYYSTAATEFKDILEKSLETYISGESNKNVQSLMLEVSADEIFELISKLPVSIIGIFSFALSGISVSIFSALVTRISKFPLYPAFALFIPSKLAAIMYIISAIVNAFSEMKTTMGIAVSNAYIILTLVFACVGFKYIISVAKLNGRPLFTITLILAIVFMPPLSITILSFLGAFISTATTKIIPKD
jgi:hypothetical protein